MKPIQVNQGVGGQPKPVLPTGPSQQEGSQPSDEECLFCVKFGSQPFKRIDFGPLLNRALSSKYATQSSKSCSKDITQLIENRPVKWVVDFKDSVQLEERDEYLKRFYTRREQQNKLETLLEYFKFHKDIPRLFMKKTGNVVVTYFEKQKHIAYKRIKRMLGIPVSDKTNDETQNSKHHLSKASKVMVLEGVSLSIKHSTQKVPESEANSQITSKSILNEMLRNITHSNLLNLNMDETWMSMKNMPPSVTVLPQPKPTIKKPTQAEQINRQRVQGLLLSQKIQSEMQTQKQEITHKKEQQEKLIRQLISDGCLKKQTQKQISAFNSAAPTPKHSPKYQHNAKEMLMMAMMPSNMKTQVSNSKDDVTSKRIHSGRVDLNARNINPVQKQSSATLKPNQVDYKQSYQVKKFPAYQSLNMRSKSFEAIKNISLINSLNQKVEESRPRAKNSHRKSQTQYSEPSFSPSPVIKHMQSVNKLSQLISRDHLKPKLSQRVSGYQSQPSININIHQLNMNTLNVPHSQLSRLIKHSSQSMHHIPKKTELRSDFYSNNYYHNPKPAASSVYNSHIIHERTKSTKINSKTKQQ